MRSYSNAAQSFPIAIERPNVQGLFARFSAIFMRARQRHIDAKIAQMMQSNGGMMTDSVEREIESYFGIRR